MRSVKLSNDIVIGNNNPLVLIAGPCSIESRDLAFSVAEQVKAITEKLGIPYVFKASFDKANRTSIHSYRGPGLEKGLEILADIKREFNIPVTTDIHDQSQAKAIGEVVDIIQIPAFLCRQTDLLIAAANTGKVVNVKKGQFLSPWDTKNIVVKLEESGTEQILLTERGSSFGYNNLVVDMRSLLVMKENGVPVVFDATHSVQQPGGNGTSTGGKREYVPHLSRAAAAIGIDALFMEVHPDPDNAFSDGPNMVKLNELEEILKPIINIDRIVKQY